MGLHPRTTKKEELWQRCLPARDGESLPTPVPAASHKCHRLHFYQARNLLEVAGARPNNGSAEAGVGTTGSLVACGPSPLPTHTCWDLLLTGAGIPPEIASTRATMLVPGTARLQHPREGSPILLVYHVLPHGLQVPWTSLLLFYQQ